MVVTAQYRYIFLPIGVIGVGMGYYLYFREKRRCAAAACTFAGRKANLALLVFATVIVAAAFILDTFPEVVSSYLQMVL